MSDPQMKSLKQRNFYMLIARLLTALFTRLSH